MLWLPFGAEAVTYANTATPFNWIDASSHTKVGYNTVPYRFNGGGGCGTNPPTLDDTLSDNIPLGFTFMYGGVNFTQVRIMSNGRLQFNNNTTCGYGSPVTQLPYPNAGLNYTMRIYGNDLDPTLKSDVPAYPTVCLNSTSCYISYATIGTAPYRSFVVTWFGIPEWAAGGSTSGNYNLQVILQENGEFIYQYGVNTPGPSASLAQVGWQADSNDYDVPAVGLPASNTAIKFYIPQPVAEYRMEQPSWNGTANEVLDTSGNARHATALQAAAGVRPQDVAGGQVCRGGQINHNTATADISAIATPVAIPSTVGGAGTISFWYNNSANAPNLTRLLFDATTTANRFFYLQRTNNRALSFRVTDSGNTNRTVTTANNVLPAAGWSHIAVSWNFNNLAAANSDRLRIWVNGVLQTTSAFTTANVVSNQIGTLYIGDNRSNSSPSGTSAGNPGGTTATLDEFRIYNYEGGLALVQRDMNQTGTCLNHYAISHAGNGQACQTNNVTVTAHDNVHGLVTMPNNTTQIALSTSTGEGDWALVNGYGVLNNGIANDGIATYLWNGEYQAEFALTHSTPDTVNFNVTDGQIVEGATEDPLLTLAACFANFNACHNYAASHCSAATGKLYTRLSGVGSDYDIVALDGADNVATTFTGKAVVSLIARANPGAVDAQNCFTAAPDYTQVLDNAVTSFTAGRLTLTNKTVPGAWREARIKVVCDSTNCPPAGMTWCSVDNYAIRPQAFTVTANLGGPTLKAGLPFTLDAASGTTTYDGTPVLNTVLMQDHNGAGIGALSGTLPIATGGDSSGTFYYHDVGTLSLLADAVKDATHSNVDNPAGCVAGSTSNTLSGGQYGCDIGSNSAGPFGRFYPDHFTYTASLMPACSGFTYMDQPGLGITLNLQAMSFTEQVTTRYTAGYGFLGTFNITGDNGGNPVSVARLNPALPLFTWANGSYNGNGTYTFSRDTAPDGPLDSFALKANILSEPDGIAISGSDLSATTKIRYGRIKIANAYGSELLSMKLPVTVQYYNNGWLTNDDDSCTVLAANQFAHAFGGSLAACETAGTLTGSAPGFTLQLANPGAGNTGTDDLTLNLGSSASGNTCITIGVSGPAATTANQPWLQLPGGGNPGARATFGIYKGNNAIIYRREAY